MEDVAPDTDLVASLEDMDRSLLVVVHVKGRAALGRDLNDEVTKRAAGVFTRDLEAEYAHLAEMISDLDAIPPCTAFTY